MPSQPDESVGMFIMSRFLNLCSVVKQDLLNSRRCFLSTPWFSFLRDTGLYQGSRNTEVSCACGNKLSVVTDQDSTTVRKSEMAANEPAAHEMSADRRIARKPVGNLD